MPEFVMTPAIEFLESPEYVKWAEEQRWGEQGVHRAELNTGAYVAVGPHSTVRRPMFEIITDHKRYCPLYDCSKAKSQKAVREAARKRRQALARGEEWKPTRDTAKPAGDWNRWRMAFWERIQPTTTSSARGTS